ncbi:hypothetical protein [Mucilaginibacter segetis]|uniref:Cytochrome oxidase complex assembly protein 1 n=1 Tax=Mucilaginibacter segetis TaxID=2793071 RepID=A0A934UMH6_9SPHI|nr:hypothetical protein [Mucilaginibacter segetis]MBK0379419.1 hypothetical protein [Mucilaginibacter segetis]
MEKDILIDKTAKKKSAKKMGWVVVVFVIIFAVVLIKFAFTGSLSSFSGLPDSDAAYGVAKEFITPTVRSGSISFHDSEYQFAKKSDSVYVIRSSYTSKDDNGENSDVKFRITLKYNGGAASNQNNWTMLNLDQD